LFYILSMKGDSLKDKNQELREIEALYALQSAIEADHAEWEEE